MHYNIQVSDTRITIAIDASDTASEALDLPERCRVVKLANSVTYDRYRFHPVNAFHLTRIRMEKTLDRLERRILGTTKVFLGHETQRITG